MDIEYRKNGRKWIAEVWSIVDPDDGSCLLTTEEQYTEINDWCIDNFGYHSRTAYHVFEFKRQADLEWFVLKWA
jgi:hypothetical protein